jgi:hypothetical protein
VTSAAYSSALSSHARVPGVDDVELAVGQPLIEILADDRRHDGVVAAGDDLHRRLDLR